MEAIFSQLKERKLVQWMLAYSAAAFAVLQFADLVGGQFDWPAAVLRSVTVVLVGGFFAALVLAWYHGERAEARASWQEIALLSTIMLSIGGAVLMVSRDGFGRPAPGSAAVPARSGGDAIGLRSIAVLPFDNLSGNAETTYFSDGVMEDVLTALGRIGELQVVSRAAVMRYRDTELPHSEIGGALGVRYLVQGSVRRQGNRLRVSAQLVDAASGRQLWADVYDRQMTDVFAIQSEIAQSIAEALQARITNSEQARLSAAPTENTEAYDLYLRGRDYYYRLRREDNALAASFFRQAIELDPGFAQAHAGLANMYSMSVHRFGAPLALADTAILLATRATELNPNAAEPHRALGTAYLVRGYGRRAIAPLKRALELDAAGLVVHNNIGIAYYKQGRYDEALLWFRQGRGMDQTVGAVRKGNTALIYSLLELHSLAEAALRNARAAQPNLPQVDAVEILMLLHQGRYDEAARVARGMTDLHATDATGWILAGDALLMNGREREARAYYEQGYTLSKEPSPWMRRYPVVLLAHALVQTGDPQRAQALAREFIPFARAEIERGNESFELPYSLAAAHALLGERAEAMSWLRQLVERGYADYGLLTTDPLLAELRSDPDFVPLAETVRARVDRMRERVRSVKP